MQKTFINSFSYVRIFACYAIIVLHSLFASTVYFDGKMSGGDILWERIAEHMLMWAVPMFLMVTGALLLNPERKLTARKVAVYIRRMAVTLVVFTFIFQIFDYCTGDQKTLFTGWLKNLIFARSWAHMWYIYMMIGLYFMIPVYQLVTSSDEKVGKKSADGASKEISSLHKGRLTVYIILILFVFTSVLPEISSILQQVTGKSEYSIGFGLPVTAVYPLYLFLGYQIWNHRPGIVMSTVLTVVCSALIVASSIFFSPALSEILSGYSSVLVVGQSAGIFGLMCRIPWEADNWVRSMDKCTFGIYVIHMAGIRWLMKVYGWNPYEYGPCAFILLALVLFFVSYALTWVIRKIPRINLL